MSGDINRFLDLCYDYYGIPRGVLAADEFSNKEMNWFKTRTESEYFEDIKLEAAARREYKSRQVCITGASSQITEILIMEILKIHGQSREGGLVCKCIECSNARISLSPFLFSIVTDFSLCLNIYRKFVCLMRLERNQS